MLDYHDEVNTFFIGRGDDSGTAVRNAEIEVEKAKEKLLNAQKVLWDLQNTDTATTFVTKEAMESLFTAYPFMTVRFKNNIGLTINLNNVPIAYHFGTDDPLYQTYPIHSFTITKLDRTNMHIKNNKTKLNDYFYLTSPELIKMKTDGADFTSCRNDRVVTHPHDSGSDAVAGTGEFSRLCYGTNRWGELITREKIPSSFTVVEYLRRIAIWFSTANLSDMYGTYPSPKISMPPVMMSSEVKDFSEVLWRNVKPNHGADFNKEAYYNNVKESIDRLPDSIHAPFDNAVYYMLQRAPLERYQAAYSLWVYTHVVLARHIQSSCFENSVALDVAMTFGAGLALYTTNYNWSSVQTYPNVFSKYAEDLVFNDNMKVRSAITAFAAPDSMRQYLTDNVGEYSVETL